MNDIHTYTGSPDSMLQYYGNKELGPKYTHTCSYSIETEGNIWFFSQIKDVYTVFSKIWLKPNYNGKMVSLINSDWNCKSSGLKKKCRKK